MTGPVRIGVAGLGSVAQVHLEAYTGMGGVEVVAGADPAPAARDRAVERFGLRAHESAEELLAREQLDMLCVLSSVNTHRAIVEEAARRGVPVLCEKPMAVSVADAVAMDETCHAADVPLYYGSSYRSISPVVEARRLIADGCVGQVELVVETFVGGRGPSSQQPISSEHYPSHGPGGTGMGIVDHGIHFFDFVPWLVGVPIRTVFGRGNRTGAPLRPEFAYLTLEGGIDAQLLCWDGSWSTKLPNEGTWTGGGCWDISAGYSPAGTWARDTVEVHIFGTDGALRILPYAHHLFLSDDAGCREISLSGPPSPGHFATQLQAVVAALGGDTSRAVPSSAGIQALVILEALYESDRTGAVQAIEPELKGGRS